MRARITERVGGRGGSRTLPASLNGDPAADDATVAAAVLGACVIGFLSAGLVISGVSSYWQTVFTGAVIVLAVLMNSLQYGSGARKG